MGNRSDRRAPKKAGKPGGSGKTFAIVGAIALLFCCLCVGVPGGVLGIGWWQLGWFREPVQGGKLAKDGGAAKGGPDPVLTVTADSFNRVKFGMNLAEVNQVLGPGKTASIHDVTRAYAGKTAVPSRTGKGTLITSWAEWRSGQDVIHVGFANTRSGELCCVKLGLLAHPIGGQASHSGTFDGDLAAHRDKWVAEQRLFDDPKWAKGPKIRALLPGRYVHPKGKAFYEFTADGTVQGIDTFRRKFNGKYQFKADDIIEMTLPGSFNKEETKTYRVYVSADELMLSHWFMENWVIGDVHSRQK